MLLGYRQDKAMAVTRSGSALVTHKVGSRLKSIHGSTDTINPNAYNISLLAPFFRGLNWHRLKIAVWLRILAKSAKSTSKQFMPTQPMYLAQTSFHLRLCAKPISIMGIASADGKICSINWQSTSMDPPSRFGSFAEPF
jgi:hypothetical protein